MDRTMVKITENDDSFAVKTKSRDFCSPHNFYILKSELDRMKREGSIIVKDISSYAELQYLKTYEGRPEKIRIRFSWINSIGDGTLTGRTELLFLPTDSFNFSLCNGREVKKVLSVPDKLPAVEFRSRRNLRCVAENKKLRRKLGHFLDRSFRWADYERIVIFDDFTPYSFVFDAYSRYGNGISGGVILHGQENLETSYYSMHT